jgi:hypothetical protein
MYLPFFILVAGVSVFVSVSATLETGTWRCPKYIHYYSNITSSTPGCNDTASVATKPKPARDYKPACCSFDTLSFPAASNSDREFGATGCESYNVFQRHETDIIYRFYSVAGRG